MASKIGFVAFILGFIGAIIGGIIAPANTAVVIVLIILGLLIGLLNISAKETMLFLVATIALIVVGRVFSPLTVLNLGRVLDDHLKPLKHYYLGSEEEVRKAEEAVAKQGKAKYSE